MSGEIGRRGASLLVLLGLLSGSNAMAQGRSAGKILDEIKAVEMPARPANVNDQDAGRDYIAKQQAAMLRRAELIGDLLKANPDQPELANLLPARWAVIRSKITPAELMAEIDGILSRSKDEKVLLDANFHKTLLTLIGPGQPGTASDAMKVVDAFISKYPRDPRIANLLMTAASSVDSPDDKELLFKRIEKDYANPMTTRQVAAARSRLEGERNKLARVGKPFELEFTDAIKGTQVTMASLKGKVVVIDFWATWCGPCIAEIPNMKRIYAEYKDKGVEFIGVSLDQPKEKGGLDKLKDYVAKNDIQWPQYYQGNYWQSEFSSSWGIDSIPAVFLVDADGNLASINARGQARVAPARIPREDQGEEGRAEPLTSGGGCDQETTASQANRVARDARRTSTTGVQAAAWLNSESSPRTTWSVRV